jgi:hypothetical protein
LPHFGFSLRTSPWDIHSIAATVTGEKYIFAALSVGKTLRWIIPAFPHRQFREKLSFTTKWIASTPPNLTTARTVQTVTTAYKCYKIRTITGRKLISCWRTLPERFMHGILDIFI